MDCSYYQVKRKGGSGAHLVYLTKKRHFVAQHPKLLLRLLIYIVILLLFKMLYPSVLSVFVFARIEYHPQHIN